jgi:hypothetical protein
VADDSPRDTIAGEAPAARAIHHVGQEFLQLSLGAEGGMRHFAYRDGITANLRPYTLNAAPLVAAGAELYPLAGEHVVDLGLVLGYAHAFAVQSATVDAGRLETQWSRTSAGARARARTGPVETAPVFGLTGAYGEESFAIASSNPNAALPSVDYRFVRASADARVPLGRFAVSGQFGYLAVLAAGDVAARFPKASVAGVEAELGGSMAIAWGLEARVTASYRRFFYGMNPTPGDTYVAGGALDELASVQAGLAYVY